MVAKSTQKKREIKEFIWDLVKAAIISLVIILPVRYYLIQPFLVKGSSMEPNFSNGNYLIVNELVYRFENPRRGDVVVFRYPNDPSQYYIKRIVGMPGETVEIKNGEIKIFNQHYKDGIKIDEPYLMANITPGSIKEVVKENNFFVLGDNRFASSDSRVWGVLPEKNIIGKVWLRAFPVTKAQVFRDFTNPLQDLE